MPATRSKVRKTVDIVESNVLQPPMAVLPPKKRGRTPKATASLAASDDEGGPPAKKLNLSKSNGMNEDRRPAATSRAKPAIPTRDALPARNGRNEHPAAKANLLPTPRRSSKQVAADREALRKAAEEQIERAKEATAFLAQMQVDEERFDEEMEADIPRRLSAATRMQPDGETESFESVSSGSESSESFEDDDKLAKNVVSIV